MPDKMTLRPIKYLNNAMENDHKSTKFKSRYRQWYQYFNTARNVLDGKEGAIENYMQFLQSGGSDYPIEILKKAGVDMSSPEPVEEAMQLFDSLVIQMEELLLNQ